MENNLSLLSFIIASLIILIIPGPGVAYVVARSLAQGYTACFVSAFGLSAGVLVHVLGAVIGLSALLHTSAIAFAIIKYLGAGYLIYLGFQIIRSTRKPGKPQSINRQPMSRVFLDGVFVSVFNPKIALFFLAFLPQFASPESGSTTLHILYLGLLYAALAFTTDSMFGLVSITIRNTVRSKFINGPMLQYVTGSLLIALGVRAALTSQRS